MKQILNVSSLSVLKEFLQIVSNGIQKRLAVWGAYSCFLFLFKQAWDVKSKAKDILI